MIDLSTSARTDFINAAENSKKQTLTLDRRIIPVYSASTTVVPTRSCQCFNFGRLCWQQTPVTMEIRLVVSAASLSWERRPTVTLSTCASINDWWTVTQSPWQTGGSTALSFDAITIVIQKSPRHLRAAGCETLMLPLADIQIKMHH